MPPILRLTRPFTAVFLLSVMPTRGGIVDSQGEQLLAKTVVVAFLKEVVILYGIPKSIVNDRVPIFLSNFWIELFKLKGTQLNMCTTYYLETDGQTEVLNRGLKMHLRCFASKQPRQWCSRLHWTKYWYNTSPHSAAQATTFELVYSRPPLPYDNSFRGD